MCNCRGLHLPLYTPRSVSRLKKLPCTDKALKEEEEEELPVFCTLLSKPIGSISYYVQYCTLFYHSYICNKAVRQRSDLLFIETSFWFEESPCAVRTNTAGLGRLCTLFVFSTLLVFEHMHAVLSSSLVLCCTMVTTKHCCYE